MSGYNLFQRLIVSMLLLASGFTLNMASAFSQSQSSDKVEFFCDETFDRASGEYIPATFVWIPQEQENRRVIGWKSQHFYKTMTTQERCKVVSEKFQKKYENGDLSYVILGKNNGYPILCGVGDIGDACDGNSQLFTLKHHADSKEVHTRLSGVLSGQISDMLMQSSGSEAYIPFDELIENLPVVNPVNNN
ncbi:COP23 domain-containing protein [Crocosphaera watsonii]|uniref:Uncharacterized protein n=2 Tax=Crocosphaera watsonii TaxID=263511 RepID=G5JEV9_CROWT|nr:COP23 domain-containing protein [Crocosphaera watsonii]EHJ09275.1 hypothetical protein CWATWH0003_B296 [Crocosphaera watsonii WH 0003]CCQ55033.1 hypothetical protein CWATWH0005_4319 [Crocosphaera watsonii WH 0005]